MAVIELPLPLTGTGAARALPPSKKVTKPLNRPVLPVVLVATVAVNVSDWP